MSLNGGDLLREKELQKRRRERFAILAMAILWVLLTWIELRLARSSSALPFLSSVGFFGLLNLNVILLIGLAWLLFRNVGKLYWERRHRVLGSSLKTKLVVSFLSFSIIPTLVLFVISSLYINSSFDKWFSIKIKNTLQASIELTQNYYKNADQTALHFADHVSGRLSQLIENLGNQPHPIQKLLEEYKSLLALHAVEYYPAPLEQRLWAKRSEIPEIPRLSVDFLSRIQSGVRASTIQHIQSGDLIRAGVPVLVDTRVRGILVVSTFVPVSLAHQISEITQVFGDYKEANPLQYPIKTAYFVLLVIITLVIIIVAIWIGLYLAKELTVPLERLVLGAQAVGSGNFDIRIPLSSHQDELTAVVLAFNRMIDDVKAKEDSLRARTLQTEAILANVGTGVIVIGSAGEVLNCNRAARVILALEPTSQVGRKYSAFFGRSDLSPLHDYIAGLLGAGKEGSSSGTAFQWLLTQDNVQRSLVTMAAPLFKESGKELWGLVLVVDDLTDLVKAQREVAWREVARRIAHEIKNPLTPIKLSAQRLQRRLQHLVGNDAQLVKECTDTIIQQTNELRDMVNEFSQFARLPEVNPAPNDLNEVIQEVVTLYAQAHPSIQFTFVAESRLPIFNFDRDQIKRAIVNVVDNAVSVLKEDGKQRIRTIRIETHYHSELQLAVTSIQDNGPGMTDETLARAFEPYFSTRKEGTGLGLAITKRIINDHDGFVRIFSKSSTPDTLEGPGTQFVIELPTTHKGASTVWPSGS